MDTQTYPEDEYIPDRSPEELMYISSGGGMFAGSQYFTIGGGTFNNTNHYHPSPAKAPNFRMIPMGDIDLQQELMVNEKSGIVDHRLGRERYCVRRVYSAKIDGRNTDLTVAMYEGNGAEEAWKQDVKMYMSLRHPNIIQMYGTARSGAMYATIFHGDLIQIREFVASASPIIAVYTYAYYVGEWKVCDYLENSPYSRFQLDYEEHSTVSIRRSNGRLSADFVLSPDPRNQANRFFYPHVPRKSLSPMNPSREASSQEAAAIESLTLEQYHDICLFSLYRRRSGVVLSSATVRSGVVYFLPPSGQAEEAFAFLTEAKPTHWDWTLGKGWARRVMANQWTRLNARDVRNSALTDTVTFTVESHAWLAQANHIFSRLSIASNLDDCVLLERVSFRILIGNGTQTRGYLFLCPGKHFRDWPTSFRWPDCPAYWSLDPLGAERLSTEEATQLGFPSFQLTTEINGIVWDSSVYTGLRQFHQAKGFDPASQEVARHLKLPLFRLFGDPSPPSAQVDELGNDNEDWFDDCIYEEVREGLAAKGSLFNDDDAEEDGEHSFYGLDSEGSQDDNAQVEACAQWQDAPRDASEANQSQRGPHSANLEANLEPQITNDHATSGSFIDRLFWGLHQALATENLNTDISPYLV